MSVLNSLTTLSSGYYIALIVCLTHVTQGAKYSCQASISVSEGHPANISCYFSENVQVTKKNVKIHKITDKFNPDGVVVAECFWSDAQNFRCEPKNGYKMEGEITNSAMLVIPWATKAFEGKYMCELVPSEPSDIEPCEFRIKEGDDAININLSIPDISVLRSLIIAAIVISALTFVIVLVCAKDRIVACLRRLRESTKTRCCKATGTNIDDGKEDIPLDDTDKKDLNAIVEKAVTSALLEVAQTDTGTLLISTLSEIQKKKWKYKDDDTFEDLSQQSMGVAATMADTSTSKGTSRNDNSSDQQTSSRIQGTQQAAHENTKPSASAQSKTPGTRLNIGKEAQGKASAAGNLPVQLDLNKSPNRAIREGNVIDYEHGRSPQGMHKASVNPESRKLLKDGEHAASDKGEERGKKNKKEKSTCILA